MTKQEILDMAKTTTDKNIIEILIQSNRQEINESLLYNPNLNKNQFSYILRSLYYIVDFYKNNETLLRTHIEKYGSYIFTDDIFNFYVRQLIKHFRHIFTRDEIFQILVSMKEKLVQIIVKEDVALEIDKSLFTKYLVIDVARGNRVYGSPSRTNWQLNIDEDTLINAFKSESIDVVLQLIDTIGVKFLTNNEIKALQDLQDLRILSEIQNVVCEDNHINTDDVIARLEQYYINKNANINIEGTLIDLSQTVLDEDQYTKIFKILDVSSNEQYKSIRKVKEIISKKIPIDMLLSLEINPDNVYINLLSWETVTSEQFDKLLQKFPKETYTLYKLYKEYNIANDNLEQTLNLLYEYKDKLDESTMRQEISHCIVLTIKNKQPTSLILIELHNTYGCYCWGYPEAQFYIKFILENVNKLNVTTIINSFKAYNFMQYQIDDTIELLSDIRCPIEILEYLNTSSGKGSNRFKQAIRNNPTYIAMLNSKKVERDIIDDVRDIIKIAINRGVIRQADKDDLGITRDNDTIRDIWKSLVEQEFISNKQQKYVDLAKRAIS